MLILERPWTRQPQTQTPAKPGWLRVYNFSQRGADAARGAARLDAASLAYEVKSAGKGVRVNAALALTTNEHLGSEISSAITVVFIAEKFGKVSTSEFLLGEHSTSGGAYNFGFYEGGASGNLFFFVHNGSSGVSTTGATAWVAGAGPQVWVATYGGGDNNIRLYLNGAQVTTAAQTGNIQRNTGALFRSCFWQSGVPNFNLYAAAVSTRNIGASEVMARFSTLASAYGELFAPRRVYIPTAAAAAASTYTLTSATWVPGSITATGVTPRIVRTKS